MGIPTLLLAAVALLAPPLPTDTVIAVATGTRLDVEAWGGRVDVRVWDRDAVRVRTGGGAGNALDVSQVRSVLRLRQAGASAGSMVEYTITIPRWMGVSIHGQHVDVSVSGTNGEVGIETVGGRAVVDGGRGRVSVRTIHGAIVVRNTTGRVDAWTVNEAVLVERVVGDISVETTNGGIHLRDVRTSNARAATMNGSVSYDGTLVDRGRYVFTTHNGSITVNVPEATSAAVSAGTYHGSFRAGFPVHLTGMSRERHYDFILGSGGARVELESFSGDIVLQRPPAGR